MDSKQSRVQQVVAGLVSLLVAGSLFLLVTEPANATPQLRSVTVSSSLNKFVVKKFKSDRKTKPAEKLNTCLRSAAIANAKSSAQHRKWQPINVNQIASQCGVKTIHVARVKTSKKNSTKTRLVKTVRKNSAYKKARKSVANLYGSSVYRDKKSKVTWTVLVTGELVPVPTPVNLRVTQVQDSRVTVAWNGVTNAQRYALEWRANTDKTPKTLYTNNTSYTFNGLVNGRDYVVTVRAENSAGTKSKQSTPVTIRSTGLPDQTPETDGVINELAIRTAMYQEHSLTRFTFNLPVLSTNMCLQNYAEAHARVLAQNHAMYHQDLKPILSACGTSMVGENVALGHTGAAHVQGAWMDSPGHRANILNKNFNRIGASAFRGSNGRLHFVVVFGR